MSTEMANEQRIVDRLEACYDELLEERSLSLGVSLEAAAELSHDRPLFVEAAGRRAQRLGTTPDQLMADYANRIKESNYPSPYCLKPEEVQEFSASGHLSPEQNVHVESCQPCRSLLERCRLSPEQVESLMDNIRRMSAQPKSRQVTASVSAAVGGRSWMAAATNFLRTK